MEMCYVSPPGRCPPVDQPTATHFPFPLPHCSPAQYCGNGGRRGRHQTHSQESPLCSPWEDKKRPCAHVGKPESFPLSPSSLPRPPCLELCASVVAPTSSSQPPATAGQT